MSRSGLKIAALYGFRPHNLGLCGPEEARQQQLLKKFLQGEISATKIRPVLKKFLGACSYYKLIAKSNRIKNSFNEQVVRAYWVGNKLLDRVKIDDLRKMLTEDFSEPGLLRKEVAVKKAAEIPNNSKPHHSFHVLTIGSVTGSVDFKNTKLKDTCRVGWGKIIKISNFQFPISKIIVKYQPLRGRKEIKLGKAIQKEIIWDKGLVPNIRIGDWVSFHWDWIVQILTKKEVSNLKKYTLNTLDSLK